MNRVDPAQVTAALANFPDPETGRSVVAMEQVSAVEANAERISLTLALSTHSAPIWEETRAAVVERLTNHFQVPQVDVVLAVHPRPADKKGQLGLRVKSVITVGSGKGGVGKSTIATCLALALKRAGSKVGLMDADVYGPSIPQLTGTSATPADIQAEEKKLNPILLDGMPIMSIGYLITAEQPVIWRGPMLHSAVTQFLRDTLWGELDYLIIDMPPGTGDIALTLSQAIQPTGAVVVCTPQQVALLDAIKAIGMFRTVKIPVLGMVENMSGFVCPDCHKRYDIFGSGGARRAAEQLGVPFLGDVPLHIPIRQHGDDGDSLANFADPQAAPYFEKIACSLVRNLARQAAEEPPQPELPMLG